MRFRPKDVPTRKSISRRAERIFKFESGPVEASEMSEIPKRPESVFVPEFVQRDDSGLVEPLTEMVAHYQAVAKVAVEALRVAVKELRPLEMDGSFQDRFTLNSLRSALRDIEASGWKPPASPTPP